MARTSPGLPVLLPWAAGGWTIEDETRRFAVSGQPEAQGLAPQGRQPAGTGTLEASVRSPAARRPGGSLSAPRLAHRPEPTIPETDRAPFDEGGALAAAVALDVLATWTEPLAGRPTVLAELTAVLVRLLELGGEQDERAPELLDDAGSPRGDARALVSRRLAACLQAEDPQQPVTPSSPEGVALALRRLERMAELVVREAHLLLESRAGTDYRQV